MKNPANQIAQLRDRLTALENSDTVQPLNELTAPNLRQRAMYYGKQALSSVLKTGAKNPIKGALLAHEASKKVFRAIMFLLTIKDGAKLMKDIDNDESWMALGEDGLETLLSTLGIFHLGIPTAILIGKQAWKLFRGTPLTDEEKVYCDKMADYYYRKLKRPPTIDDDEIVDPKFFKRILNTYNDFEKEYGKVGTGKATAASAPAPASLAAPASPAPASPAASTPAAPAPTASTPAASAPTASSPAEPSTQELQRAAGIPQPKKKLSDLL